MFACGAGGLDVAVAMGGGAYYITMPEVVKIELKGKLNDWVSAKDVILIWARSWAQPLRFSPLMK